MGCKCAARTMTIEPTLPQQIQPDQQPSTSRRIVVHSSQQLQTRVFDEPAGDAIEAEAASVSSATDVRCVIRVHGREASAIGSNKKLAKKLAAAKMIGDEGQEAFMQWLRGVCDCAK